MLCCSPQATLVSRPCCCVHQFACMPCLQHEFEARPQLEPRHTRRLLQGRGGEGGDVHVWGTGGTYLPRPLSEGGKLPPLTAASLMRASMRLLMLP